MIRELLCDGYAVKKPFDVTVPNNPNFWVGLMIFYSFSLMPWLIIFIIATVITRRLSMVFTCSVIAFEVLFNEFVIKTIVHQPRPEGTCLDRAHSYGMPSSHSVFAAGFIFFFIPIVLTYPYAALHDNTIMQKLKGKWKERERLLKGIIVFLILFFFAPIPFSRVVLQDHYWGQIGAGALEGCGFSLLVFGFFHLFVRKRFGLWQEKSKCLRVSIKNDYVASDRERDGVDLEAQSAELVDPTSFIESDRSEDTVGLKTK